MVKLVFIWAITALLFIAALMVTIQMNFTFGTVIMWAAFLLALAYAIFHKPIHAFTQKGFGRVLKYTFLAGVIFFVGMFIFVAVSGYTHSAQGNEQAIIVLGAGLRGERPGDVLRRRLDAAAAAYAQNPDVLIVVSGGKGTQETIPEALAMQRYLLKKGIPEDAILMEDKSTSTKENLEFSREILQQHGISADAPVAIVTNAFHCYRALQYAKMMGFTDARSIPASMNWKAILPAYSREVFTILFYWIFRR